MNKQHVGHLQITHTVGFSAGGLNRGGGKNLGLVGRFCLVNKIKYIYPTNLKILCIIYTGPYSENTVCPVILFM